MSDHATLSDAEYFSAMRTKIDHVLALNESAALAARVNFIQFGRAVGAQRIHIIALYDRER